MKSKPLKIKRKREITKFSKETEVDINHIKIKGMIITNTAVEEAARTTNSKITMRATTHSTGTLSNIRNINHHMMINSKLTSTLITATIIKTQIRMKIKTKFEN